MCLRHMTRTERLLSGPLLGGNSMHLCSWIASDASGKVDSPLAATPWNFNKTPKNEK